MNNQTFSQLGQDLWVLSKYPNIKGYFVDIGFSDGIFLNNTYLLELNGWLGIGIDPLATNFNTRINTKIYKNTLSSCVEVLDFATTPDKVYSGIVKNINCHKEFLNNPKTIIEQVQTTTLLHILIDAKSPKFIHYLSLDVEGSEYDILKDFPFETYRFGCISVEHNYVEPQRTKIRTLLSNNGYKLDKTLKFDDFYVQKSAFCG